MFPEVFHISIRGPINEIVRSLVVNYGSVFKAISQTILQAILFVEWVLRGLPWWVIFLVFLVLAWFAAKFSRSERGSSFRRPEPSVVSRAALFSAICCRICCHRC